MFGGLFLFIYLCTVIINKAIMSNITKEQFLQDVRTEVESLKANATPEEVANLNIKTFDFDNQDNCIYGQMTGSCESVRAKELMDKACVRVTNVIKWGMRDRTFEAFKDNINGEYTGQTWGHDRTDGTYQRSYSHLSMVEYYISLDGSSPENIMKYLKGEVETLELPLN